MKSYSNWVSNMYTLFFTSTRTIPVKRTVLSTYSTSTVRVYGRAAYIHLHTYIHTYYIHTYITSTGTYEYGTSTVHTCTRTCTYSTTVHIRRTSNTAHTAIIIQVLVRTNERGKQGRDCCCAVVTYTRTRTRTI